MAWVRPKHPPKSKSKADPVETLVPMLSYFSNRRVGPRPTSPSKQLSPVAPVPRDPILRSLQQAQAIHAEAPIIVYEDSDSDDQSLEQPSQRLHRRKVRDEPEHPAQSVQHRTTRYERRPSPPPPPRVVCQQPRVASYERSRPVKVVRERVISQPVPYPAYTERVSSRAISARWASATTPLEIR